MHIRLISFWERRILRTVVEEVKGRVLICVYGSRLIKLQMLKSLVVYGF